MARWVVAIVVAMLALVSCLNAQQSSAASNTSDSGDCSSRSIPVTLLKPADSTWDWHSLSLTVGGQAAPIQSVSVIPQPPRVLVLVDKSGSMGPEPGPGAPNWGVGLRAAAFAVEATPPESSVGLATFSEHETFGKFESRQEVGQELMGLAQQKPGHRTAIYSALKDAAGQLQPTQFGDAIFLVTDGGDNRSSEVRKETQQELVARGIRVFAFLVVTHEFRTPEEREGPDYMMELANTTGGALLQEPWSKQWLASDEAKQLAEQVRTMARWPYMLQFKPDQPLQKAAKLKITSSDKHAIQLAYPHEVLPCFALTAKSH